MLQEIWNITILGLEDVLKCQYKPVSIETYGIINYHDYCLQETTEFLRDTVKVSNIRKLWHHVCILITCAEFSL